eukprot:TRINITY_DN63289_c0_g1_i1.p2 TRINITY_DN63289_c0_g1~~TRINITY_DN63289_c0_g1_i1.p2  ORF type:complete len:171 (-),score=11.70 TRINITY_DN63289_c0_g1_i1:71-583(-)
MVLHGLHAVNRQMTPDGSGRDFMIFRDSGYSGGGLGNKFREPNAHPYFTGPTLQPWIPPELTRKLRPPKDSPPGPLPIYRMKGGCTVMLLPKADPMTPSRSRSSSVPVPRQSSGNTRRTDLQRSASVPSGRDVVERPPQRWRSRDTVTAFDCWKNSVPPAYHSHSLKNVR